MTISHRHTLLGCPRAKGRVERGQDDLSKLMSFARRFWADFRGRWLVDPLLKELPSALRVTIRSADFEFIDRMNLPKRDSLGIRTDGFARCARNMARIEESLTGHPHREVGSRHPIHVGCGPFWRSVMRNHFGHNTLAFIGSLFDLVRRSGELLGGHEGDVDVVKKVLLCLIVEFVPTVDALGLFLLGCKDDRLHPGLSRAHDPWWAHAFRDWPGRQS